MLESNLCELCRRNCSAVEKKNCLEHPRLNLGSGTLLFKNHINFDFIPFEVGELKTDIVGNIQNLEKIFQPNAFSSIFCAHVIEHFYPTEAIKLIEDCHTILKIGGKLTMEGPDIVRMVKLYINDTQRLIGSIYGNELHREQWGDKWWHRWGWTKDLIAEAMTKQGFDVVYKGAGVSHSHPERDFKVEGIKI